MCTCTWCNKEEVYPKHLCVCWKFIQNKQRRKHHGYKYSDLNEKLKHHDSCREYATIATNNVYGNFKSISLLVIGNLL